MNPVRGETVELTKILMTAVVVLVAAAAPTFGGGPGHVVVTKSDEGKQISVPLGAIIEVRLKQAGATGYQWKVLDLDTGRLEMLESGTRPLAKPPLLGGPVLATWRLKAVGRGQTELKILLYRPWEGPEKAAEKFQVRLLIN